ncbi:MAG: hypothetical protein HKM06_06290 [Spirochaetales bacterium]|nr:hypothetical protein [Spirochaetales bacterium]
MKNDAVMNGKKVSIRPTLLISLMGSLDDVHKVCTTDFLKSGDLVILLGETRSELAGTIAEKISGRSLPGVPSVFPQRVLPYYKALSRAVQKGLVQSAHDLSDGGLAVALAESVIGGRLGVLVSLDEIPGFLRTQSSDTEILFSETPSRFLLTVSPSHLQEFQKLLGTAPMAILGAVTEEPRLVVESRGKPVLRVELDELLKAWNTLAGLV